MGSSLLSVLKRDEDFFTSAQAILLENFETYIVCRRYFLLLFISLLLSPTLTPHPVSLSQYTAPQETRWITVFVKRKAPKKQMQKFCWKKIKKGEKEGQSGIKTFPEKNLCRTGWQQEFGLTILTQSRQNRPNRMTSLWASAWSCKQLQAHQRCYVKSSNAKAWHKYSLCSICFENYSILSTTL